MKRITRSLAKLNKPCEPIKFITDEGMDKTECEEIIKELRETMESRADTVALAASQIGINARIFCLRFEDKIKIFINPIIIKKSGSTITGETFVSMPGKEILVARPDEITAVYYTDEYKYEENKFIGAAARLFDQTYQLLDGITPADIGLVSDIHEDGSIWDLTEEEFAEMAEIYKKFVAVKSEMLKRAVDENEGSAKAFKELSFAENVINGRTLVVKNDPPMNREQRRKQAKMNKIANKINKMEAKENHENA